MMSCNSRRVNLLKYLTRVLLTNDINCVMTILFLCYTSAKVQKLQRMRLHIQSLPNVILHTIINKYFVKLSKNYIDYASCALGMVQCKKSSKPFWANVCCLSSNKKYKILLVPFDNTVKNKLYISETTLFNIETLLSCKDHSTYFITPASEDCPRWAEKAKVSLISNHHDYPAELIDTLLENYFSSPKYLRTNDLITTDIAELASKYLFILPNPQSTIVHFKINSIKFNGITTNKPCYIFCDETRLIQESNIHEYLPPVYTLPILIGNVSSIEDELSNSIDNFPLPLYKPLRQLQDSIRPFMLSENWRGLKPVFLIKGPSGCGKFKLIQCLTQRLGFNFINVDCSEIQSLSAVQTEAKLRIILHNAMNSVPCILKLSNISIVGKNIEGKLDERITSNVSEQLNDIYRKKFKLPLIIIGTAEDDEISYDIERNFIEKIHITQLNQNERIQLIEWLLKSRNIQFKSDLSKITGLCSDYVYSDLETLIRQATKNSYKRSLKHCTMPFMVEHEDFLQACEYMQSTFSDRIGAAKVPEVHWEDIGGLANLKHELIRRIEIPLLHNLAIQSSGILLYGPPGTGKTLLAKAVATECKLHFLSVKGPELLNMYVGQSEKNVRDIFEKARAVSPCIIFFDELDALAPNRGRNGDSGGVMDRVVSQLLAEMDGHGGSARIFIIGATNRPDLIDPALLRPGRFDKLLYVGIYSEPESQLSVLKAITRKFNMENQAELNEIVASLPKNLTGADLYSVCSNAWLNAARRIIKVYEEETNTNDKKPQGPVIVSLGDFVEAVRTLVPSVSDQELLRYEKLHEELVNKPLRL